LSLLPCFCCFLVYPPATPAIYPLSLHDALPICLALAGAAAIAHDLYANVIAEGRATEEKEMRISKISTLALGVLSILLGIVFENQNVAFMVGLAFAIAASANFPVLVLSISWRGCTTRGATIGGFTGLIGATVWVRLSKTVWVAVFAFAEAIVPSPTPGILP